MEIRDQMQVLEAIKEKERIKVRTTGAVYLFHTQGDLGRIECFQTLNKERKLGMCQVDMSFEKLEVEVMDKDKCILHAIPREMSCSYIRIEVHRDSMLEIYATQSLHIEYRTDFSAEYEACEKDCQVAADAYGGFGLYPVRNLTNAKNFENGETKVYDYEFDAYGLFMLSVFPPRPYPVEQSYDERLFLRFSVQHGNKNAAYPYPTDRELEKASAYTNVLWLFETIWKGKYDALGKPVMTEADVYADASYCNYRYKAADEDELDRTVRKAHSLGMRVIPYVSPFFSLAHDEDFFTRVKKLYKRFDFDGLYLDGVSMDVLESYRIMKRLRQIVRSGILFRHCTIDPLGPSMFCPFIDTYADYTLRAEHIHDFDEKTMRYTISNRNTSNAIGYTYYWGFPLDRFELLIERTLQTGTRLYLDGLDEHDSPYAEAIKRTYFERLDAMKKQEGL